MTPQQEEGGVNPTRSDFMAPDSHGDMIAALVYRNVMVCRSCVLPEEHTMTGQFFGWEGVRDSGWTCDRCGVELEHQGMAA
jgi:hypothetical protein